MDKTQELALGIDPTDVGPEPVQSRWALRLFVAVIGLFPFVLILGTLFWMTTPTYNRHLRQGYLANTGYGLKLHGENCAVVLYGDSTALVGGLPSVIEQRTGLKTCNISDVGGVQLVNGTYVLDTYLQNNTAPKYLIFLYVPEDFVDASQWTAVSDFEGLYFSLQNHRYKVLAHFLLHDPNNFLIAIETGVRVGYEGLLNRHLGVPFAVRTASHGRMPEPSDSPTSCDQNILLRKPDTAWLASLRQKYSVNGTRVLLDTMPEAPCDVSRDFYNAAFTPGLLDNKLGTLPLNMYTDTGRLHTNDAGAAALSAMLADQIAELEATRKGGR